MKLSHVADTDRNIPTSAVRMLVAIPDHLGRLVFWGIYELTHITYFQVHPYFSVFLRRKSKYSTSDHEKITFFPLERYIFRV